MKKPLVLTLTAIASLSALTASAQGTVTLSGIADAAVRQVKNQGAASATSMVSGSNSTSRLVVRGNEDLGGGLGAGFHLEHGILFDSGTQANATMFWDRRSTVSLTSRSLGELRLGRDFVPTYVNWGRYDPFGYVGAAGANNFVSATPAGPIRNAFGNNQNTTVRSSNALQYFLPGGLGGLEGGLMWASDEGGTAANNQHDVVGARLGWAGGPASLSAAFTTSKNNLTTTGDFKDVDIGGSYALGDLRLTAAWRQFKQNTTKQTNVIVSAVYRVGAGEFKASYNQADLSGTVGTANIGGNDASQIGLGYVHNLSKRTAVYGTFARIDNDGAATFAVPGAGAALAGKNSTGYEFGIRHSF